MSRASRRRSKSSRGIRPRYEEHHQLKISDEALKAAANLAARYVPDRFMPDKAIDLIDEAGSRVRMHRSVAPPNLKQAQGMLASLQREKESAKNADDFDVAKELQDREERLRDRIHEMEREWQEEKQTDEPYVTEEDIAQVVSMWTGIPLMRIAGEESERLLQMEAALHNRIIGQQDAIEAVSRAVRRARAGLKDPKRPIGSFIFLGPTGIGKTETAKALAEFMFGSEDALIKIDMSEFMERHAVSRLVGAPPGYVGYEEGGQLTEAVRRKCVLRRAAGRDREGAPGGIQHPPANPRGRQSGGRQGPQGGLPQHDHHHDLERRLRAVEARQRPRLRHHRRRGASSRRGSTTTCAPR